MSPLFPRRSYLRKPLLVLCGITLLLLAAAPVLAGWITINTNDSSVDPAWPVTPVYSSNCANGSIDNSLEIKNAWMVNDGTDLAFRIETCATATNYSNIRMAAAIDCNKDGDVVDPASTGPDGDRKAVQIIAQGSTQDQVILYDGKNAKIVEMPQDYSERIGANFEWKLALQYVYPACRGSVDSVKIALATVQMVGVPNTRDQTPFIEWISPVDYGDAENPGPRTGTCQKYPTRTGCSGARHGLGSTLRLGALADADGGDANDATATADDLDLQADEDGVAPSPGVIWTAGGSGQLDVTVTGGSGVVNCWVDWNRDNDWADSGEKVVSEAAAVAGTNTLAFSVPAGVVYPNSYTARCRLAPAAGQAATATGATEFGEVEDYAWAFGAAGNRPAPLALSIGLPSATSPQVSWAATPSNEAYLILRSPRPYFEPGDGDVSTFTDLDAASPYDDTGVAGVPGAPVTLYYAAYGQVTSSAPDLLSPLSNRVGLFEFGLTRGEN